VIPRTIEVKDRQLAEILERFRQKVARDTNSVEDAESGTASGASSVTASDVRVVHVIHDTIQKSSLTHS
jgi:hypothetical protein